MISPFESPNLRGRRGTTDSSHWIKARPLQGRLFLFLHFDDLFPFVDSTMRANVVRKQGFVALRTQRVVRSV